MIGVDTNVLIRFLTADVEEQHRLAREFLDSRDVDDPAFISAVTLAETIWVLRRSYGFSTAEIKTCLEGLLESNDVRLEGRQAVSEALERGGNPAQLADFLTAHLGIRAGCSHTVTFDGKSAKTVPGMELLS